MRLQPTFALGIAAASLVAVANFVLAAEDRFTLTSPNGIAFSEFQGYESWPLVAPSQPNDAGGCGASPAPGCIKTILGNPVMIQAYHDGVPANGEAVPDGAVMAKVEWAKQADAGPPYAATVPGALSAVSFMVKDRRRFPETGGWGYATFKYDDASASWQALGDAPTFANRCHACHAVVRARDFVFTRYAHR